MTYRHQIPIELPSLTCPGLFVTATDTEVGKTTVTCGIASALRDEGRRVGVCKPFASGCRNDREGLVSEDAEALAHFADCRQPLEVINPIRYRPPLAPAVAAEQTGEPVDWTRLERSLTLLNQSSDCLLIEGVGGLLVPLDGGDGKITVLDLIVAIGYPVVVVTRAGLGTLNHTALTVRVLNEAGCRVVGLVVNGYVADASDGGRREDPSLATNRQWLSRMTGAPVLATVPRCDPATVVPHEAILPHSILDAVCQAYWPDLLGESVAGPSATTSSES